MALRQIRRSRAVVPGAACLGLAVFAASVAFVLRSSSIPVGDRRDRAAAVTLAEGQGSPRAWRYVAKRSREVHRIEISPAIARTAPGKKQIFIATGYDESGHTRPVDTEWEVDGGGTVSKTGVFHAQEKGLWRIGATDRKTGAQGFAKVFVGGPFGKAERLKIFPGEAKLKPGESLQFAVEAYDAKGEEVPCDPVWTATGGAITKGGGYRAGDEPGAYEVAAGDKLSGLWVRAKVTITTADGKEIGRIEVVRWRIHKRAKFLHKPDIAIRFRGSSKARYARLYLIGEGGKRYRHDMQTCRKGRKTSFKRAFNPSHGRTVEVAVFDFKNKMLDYVARGPNRD